MCALLFINGVLSTTKSALTVKGYLQHITILESYTPLIHSRQVQAH